jgi:DNA-binding beta-propeller fold protein YncE
MPLRTHFVVCTSLLIAATSPVSAQVAYISDAGTNRSVVDVFQTSTYKQKAQWTVGKNAFAAVYSPDGTKVYVSNTQFTIGVGAKLGYWINAHHYKCRIFRAVGGH